MDTIDYRTKSFDEVRARYKTYLIALGFSNNTVWEEEGFIINAVAAMPKGKTTDFPFAGMRLELKDEDPKRPSDWIELHYMAFLGDDRPRDGRDVRFETSL